MKTNNNDNPGIKNWHHAQQAPQAQEVVSEKLPKKNLSTAANEHMFLYPGGPLLTGDLLAKLKKPAIQVDAQPEFNVEGYKQNLDTSS